MEIARGDIVLFKFYFSDLKKSKNRPVLVFKDNLPYNDFVAIPISSQIEHLKDDEVLLDNTAFEVGAIPKISKLMVRKTFVVSKNIIQKQYGTLTKDSFRDYHGLFCKYFDCAVQSMRWGFFRDNGY